MRNQDLITDIGKGKKKLINFILQHPFVSLALLCVLLSGICGTPNDQLISYRIIIPGTAVGAFIWYYLYEHIKRDRAEVIKAITTGVVSLCFLLAACLLMNTGKTAIILFMTIGIIAVPAAIFIITGKSLPFSKRMVLLIMTAGFILRLGYILYTTIAQRQHDVGSFEVAYGHLAYINHLFSDFSLPEGNPTEIWQFYHPPLHHIIAAAWMRLEVSLGMSFEGAKESLQFLSLYYSSCCMIISYKLFKIFRMRRSGMLTAMAVVSFHPTFVILSGSVNNDILSIALVMGAVLYAAYWYKDPSMKNIIYTAVCIGFGMMAKLSASMVAPAVGALFLIKFAGKYKHEFKKYFRQFTVFGAICVPLGLWWGIRNYIMYKVPFGYVPVADSGAYDTVSAISPFRRLTDFSFYQFKHIFDAWGDPYYEFNPIIGIFKTSVFGEFVFGKTGDPIYLPSVILFYSGILLALAAFAAMIYSLISKNKYIDGKYKLFFGILYFSLLIQYLTFCIAYPDTCTQNMRYIPETIIIGALFLGIAVSRTLEIKNKTAQIIRYSIYAMTAIFCMASVAVYTMLSV